MQPTDLTIIISVNAHSNTVIDVKCLDNLCDDLVEISKRWRHKHRVTTLTTI